jgi:hypothetical protein
LVLPEPSTHQNGCELGQQIVQAAAPAFEQLPHATWPALHPLGLSWAAVEPEPHAACETTMKSVSAVSASNRHMDPLGVVNVG